MKLEKAKKTVARLHKKALKIYLEQRKEDAILPISYLPPKEGMRWLKATMFINMHSLEPLSYYRYYKKHPKSNY